MHRHSAPSAHAPALVRGGLTATGAALLLAGLAGPAAAHDGTSAPTGTDPAPAEESGEVQTYEVAPGDSLSAIAGAHGLDVTEGWRLLFDANPDIVDPNLIMPGQVLVIPAPDADIEPRALPTPVPPPAATPAPTQQTVAAGAPPTTQPQVAHSAPEGVWDRLAQCESGGNWQINTGNGYYGGLQFLPATWHSVGGTGLPHEHTREEQIHRGQILQQRSGWGQWPACSRSLGLR